VPTQDAFLGILAEILSGSLPVLAQALILWYGRDLRDPAPLHEAASLQQRLDPSRRRESLESMI
jgi:hypothetical protein